MITIKASFKATNLSTQDSGTFFSNRQVKVNVKVPVEIFNNL